MLFNAYLLPFVARVHHFALLEAVVLHRHTVETFGVTQEEEAYAEDQRTVGAAEPLHLTEVAVVLWRDAEDGRFNGRYHHQPLGELEAVAQLDMYLADQVRGEGPAIQRGEVGRVVVCSTEAPVHIGTEAELDELVVPYLEELIGVDVQGEMLIVESSFPCEMADAVPCHERAGEVFGPTQLLVGQSEVPIVEDDGVVGGMEPAGFEVKTDLPVGVEERGIARIGIVVDLFFLVLKAGQRVGDAGGEVEAPTPHFAIRGEDLRLLTAIDGLGAERTREKQGTGNGKSTDHCSKGNTRHGVETWEVAGKCQRGVVKGGQLTLATTPAYN